MDALGTIATWVKDQAITFDKKLQGRLDQVQEAGQKLAHQLDDAVADKIYQEHGKDTYTDFYAEQYCQGQNKIDDACTGRNVYAYMARKVSIDEKRCLDPQEIKKRTTYSPACEERPVKNSCELDDVPYWLSVGTGKNITFYKKYPGISKYLPNRTLQAIDGPRQQRDHGLDGPIWEKELIILMVAALVAYNLRR